MPHPYYKKIDVIVTILVLLVVLGHNMVTWHPAWYDSLHGWIYSFHMGAFFFVAGFLICNAYNRLASLRDYWHYIQRRLIKFGIPYCVLGTLFVLAHNLINRSSLTVFGEDLIRFLVDPLGSHVRFLWFIFVLLIYYFLAPVFCQFYRYTVLPGIVLGGYLYFCPLPRFFSGHMFSCYFLFFLCGIIAKKHLTLLAGLPEWIAWLFWGPFLYFSAFQGGTPIYLICGMLSLPCLYALAVQLSKIDMLERGFFVISKNCFAIYLFQMIFLNMVHIVFRRLPHTSFFFVMLLVVGEILAVLGSLALVEAGKILSGRAVKED